MIMHKKIGLWIAVTLATVLGVGCGGGETSPAKTNSIIKTDKEKSHDALNNPEEKEKLDHVKDLIKDRLSKIQFLEDIEDIKEGATLIMEELYRQAKKEFTERDRDLPSSNDYIYIQKQFTRILFNGILELHDQVGKIGKCEEIGIGSDEIKFRDDLEYALGELIRTMINEESKTI